MSTRGLRLLGWAVHLAFFAAWWQVALLMERQMHDERPAEVQPAAAAAEVEAAAAAAATGALAGEATPSRQRARSGAVPVAGPAGPPGRAGAPQLGMRAT